MMLESQSIIKILLQKSIFVQEDTISKEGRFDIGLGYTCIVSEMSDEMARVQFEFKGEMYEYFDDDDHLVPVSEIGEIETLPKPEGWAEDNEVSRFDSGGRVSPNWQNWIEIRSMEKSKRRETGTKE